jgi:hypothetical protein
MMTHILLMMRLRMRGTNPPLPQHAYRAWKGTVLCVLFKSEHSCVRTAWLPNFSLPQVRRGCCRKVMADRSSAEVYNDSTKPTDPQ